MKNLHTSKIDLEGLTWGALFIWWGITEIVKTLPDGTWAIGTGMILLVLNAVRYLNGIPTKGLTTVIGILALVWGVIDLVNATFHLPFELPVFGVLLIVLGLFFLVREIFPSRSIQYSDM